MLLLHLLQEMKLLKALFIFIFSTSSVAQNCLFNNDYVQVGNQLVFPSKHLEREGCFAWVQVSRRDDDYRPNFFEPHACRTALPEAAEFSNPPNTFYNVEDVIIPRETLNRLFHQNIPAHYFTGLYYINSVKTVDIHYRGRKIVTHGKVKGYVKALVYMEPVPMKTNTVPLPTCNFEIIGACKSSPCKHGKCKSISYFYVCECDFPYKGYDCDIEINLCENITCFHGKCISHLYENGSYAAYCNCDEGYTGSDCATDINECSDIANPVCLNNGKCVNEVGSYKCICPIRFDGRNCEFETDMCTFKPCQNNASCVTKSELQDGFECLCSDIFTGKTCETRIDFCQGITCMYGGTCSNLNEGGYECLCKPMLSGKHCEKISMCEEISCNFGVCKYSVDESSVFCECKNGYTGKFCDSDINECIYQENPCKNNGTCVNTSGSYKCECPSKFEGTHCEIKIDPCRSNPCSNQATCITLSDDLEEYECKCRIGFEGRLCEKKIDYCKNVTCANGGECLNTDDNNYMCKCKTGFSGRHCEEIRICDLVSCVHGTCKYDLFENGDYVSFCNCNPGYQGKDCSIDIDECADKVNYPCLNNGTCFNDIGSYHCECSVKFEGEHCEKKIDPCRSNPCSNQATCITLSDDLEEYKCKCRIGFEGRLCEKKIDYCKNVTCANGGDCINTDDNNYMCKCKTGFSGRHCEEIRICDLVSCIHGTCKYDLFENGDYVSFCNCNPGYQGKDCSIDIDECADKVNYPCLNNGMCFNDIGSYHCVCSAKFEGEHCEKKIDPCHTNLCQNQATCVDLDNEINAYECLCKPGFTGKLCETKIDFCEKVTCYYGGECANLEGDQVGYVCKCKVGFSGKHCEKVEICKIAGCVHGNCTYKLFCDGDYSYQCVCDEGFEGKDCSIDIEPCLTKPCKNGATCIVVDYGTFVFHRCLCPNGYIGESCETKISSCGAIMCLNDGECRVRSDGGYLNTRVRESFALNEYHHAYILTRLMIRNAHFAQSAMRDVTVKQKDLCLGVNCGTGYCSYTQEGGYKCVCHNGPCEDHSAMIHDVKVTMMCLVGSLIFLGLVIIWNV
ncbi:Fibropellin-1 [Trichinella nativa]|uniref:Fibropellin-1 n=1 Tax=Trichinella nativa TaxID=6335 RepID=A0A0V1LG11_9BILA|nr:Fibropellin-1 [Trichinella nativa]